MKRANTSSTAPRPLRVGLVSSVGGHLKELLELLPLLVRCDVFLVLNDEAPWLSSESLPAQPVLRRYRIVHAERDLRQLINLGEAAHLLLRERPDLLISTGASPAVPFFWLGRALGIRTLFIEDFNLVEQPSLTARLVYPLAHDFFVQWPQLLSQLPRARYAGPLFVPAPADSATATTPRSKTVFDAPRLFVALGTSDRPMTRLLRWLDELIEKGELAGPVLLQGAIGEYQPRHVRCVPMLPEPALIESLRHAQRVLCHGGCGVLGTCMKLGRRPIAIPRRADLGEAINDHQIMLCRALSDQGLATLCQTQADLQAALAQPESPPSPPSVEPAVGSAQGSLHAAVAQILSTLALEKARRPT
ncbi:MAG: hypothetical protein JNJ46_04140 [Myxococcales bacterium]|nr:hypothetical protein [Myxococcales bacterium]